MRRRGDRTVRIERGLAAMAVVGLLAAGCSNGGDEPGAGRPGTTTGASTGPDATVEIDGALIAALERYDSCDAFLADVRAEALERVGPYGLGDGGGWAFGMRAFAESADDSAGGDEARTAAPTDGAAGQAGGGDPSISGTNLQEADVDEPDVVKTDGELMVTVLDQELHVLDVSDPAAPRLLSSSPLAGWEAEVLLAGDTLLVLQQLGGGWMPEPRPGDAERIGTPDARLAPAPVDADGPVAGDIARPGGPWIDRQLTTITEVDLADPTSPEVRRTWTAEGRYVSARAVDGVARIVVQGDPSSRLPFVLPSTPEAEDAAEAANRAVIEGSTIDDWVPTLTVTGPDATEGDEARLAPCHQLYRPSTFSGFGMVGVLTADLGPDGDGPGLDVDLGVGVLSTGETVYASADHLYVATQRWAPGDAIPLDGGTRLTPDEDPTTTTEVHQFVLDGATPAAYAASGSIEGRILDQWSLSEHDGHLRVAVTEGEMWGEGSSVSSVVVLRPDGDRLIETGRVTDLGQGERIYAVRFMGDRGYVVTFRQVDPLYALDLTDPSAPTMTGELKITGYSSYLHPVGEDLLLGVGQDATDQGRVLGTQVSLFDVSDPANPTRLDQVALGEGSSSEVETDHRAFLFWEGVALVPYMSWNWTEDGGEDVRNGVVGISVDADAGTLTERGRLSHVGRSGGAIGEPAPATLIEPSTPWRGEYDAQIRRAMGIDGRVLTISLRGVLSSPLDTLEPGTWMPLD